MANPIANIDYIDTMPGVTPRSTDNTALMVKTFTSSDKVRFFNGKPEKIGGWVSVQFNDAVSGVPRSIWSGEVNGKTYTLIGSHKRVYALIGAVLTNITPFKTTAIDIDATLSTLYGTLANNPITTAIGTTIVTVADTSAARYAIGDSITLSGSAAVGGISAANINVVHTVHSIGANTWTFVAAAAASSTATGGGAAVVRATGLMRCTFANTLAEGDRIKIVEAGDTGGILAASINKEFIVRNVTASLFDFMTGGLANASVAGGGVTPDYYPPIDAGAADEAFGQGYGMGNYGVGLYGVTKTSTNKHVYPQIWYFDRYADYMMMTPGNGGALYEWTGDTTLAPVITLNSPAKINYMFVSDNSIITFGNNGTENRITTSDVGGRTVWAATAQNQVLDYTVYEATRLISHIKTQGLNLIFTERQVFTFRYIGLPNIWEIKLLDNFGIISSMAGTSIGGTAYWMGFENFYTWNGGQVTIMDSATQSVSTIRNYVFDSLNVGQSAKIFCSYRKQFNELRWHYPAAGINDPASMACTNLTEKTWWPDTLARTAEERPAPALVYPKMATSGGVIYSHENTPDDDGAAISFSLKTNRRTLSKRETLLSSFIPDSIQLSNISVTLDMFQWPQATDIIWTNTFTIAPTDGRQESGGNGRFWEYTITGNTIGQTWRMGQWAEEKQATGDGR